MSRCVYTAADAAVPGDLDDDWRCPRRTVDGGDRCAFHDPEALSVGQSVEVVFHETDDGEYAIPRFRPV